jgi:hypothetical protein
VSRHNPLQSGCGRIDLAPGDYLRMPEDFGRRFAIFVDTEEEFDWSCPLSREQRGTSATRGLPDMHRRLAAEGVQPIYLVDHPIATDPESAAILRGFLDAGECTIGTHLHPWVNPPFDEDVTGPNSFAGNLPPALERAKLAHLTDAIEQAFGQRPTVYRAGRYGVGPNTAAILRDLGYRVDVSVRALFDYSGEGGPDFRAMQPLPYWLGDGGLLEVPLTAAYVGALRRLGPALYPATGRVPRMHGLLSRTGLLGRVALTPEDMPLGDVIDALDRLIEDGLQLFSISFHSPSAAPGHTPYVRDAAGLDHFHAWWDGIFAYLRRRGVTPVSMAEIEAAAARAQPLANPPAPPLSARRSAGSGPVAQR